MLYEEKWKESYKRYMNTLKENGVNIKKMAKLQDAIDANDMRIVCTTERYKKVGLSWIKESTETAAIPTEYYLNYVTSIPIFDDTVTRSDTRYGYIPTKLECYSWGTKSEKCVRTFKFLDLKPAKRIVKELGYTGWEKDDTLNRIEKCLNEVQIENVLTYARRKYL